MNTEDIILRYLNEHRMATGSELVDEICRVRKAANHVPYTGHMTLICKKLYKQGLIKFGTNADGFTVELIEAPKPIKNKAAAELGRLGGLVGGKARAKKLSPEKRKEIATKAANARWGNRD